MEEPRYRCPKCPRVVTARELETHLAEQHYTFYPHHCRTCGYRTYNKRAIYEQCVSLKHKVVFWEVREEEQEGLLEEDLEACLRHPVLFDEPHLPTESGSTPIELPDNSPSVSVEADSALPGGKPQEFDETMQEADVIEMAQPAVVTATFAERVPPRGRGKTRFKHSRDLQVHTAITCHFAGCGTELALRGKTNLREAQKRHIHERHLNTEIELNCPIHGCKQGKFKDVYQLASHISSRHGGVKGLRVDELASYRAMQKQALNAYTELIPICFPSGAISRDRATARKRSLCVKCGKSVEAYLDALRGLQKAHVEKEHLSRGEIKCPVIGCTSSLVNLLTLTIHIGKRHGGVASLSNGELVAYRALRVQIKAASDKLLPECFPDDDSEH